MVVCELDREVSGEVLGWKLPAWQALLLHRVLPSCGGLLVYLTLMCYDFALIYEHYRNDENALGMLCLVLMIWPAVTSLVFTLASPPVNLQPDLTAYSINVEMKDLRWIVKQLARCIFFPVAAIGRYCYLIFWWMEAVCASYVEDKSRTREAILRARSSSPMELYLFLQAFLHAAPHTIVNILNLLARFNNPAYGKLEVQAVSIIVSCMRMSSTATVYRRFEREKLNGKKYPWNKNCKELNENNNVNYKSELKLNREEPIRIYETIQKQAIEARNSNVVTDAVPSEPVEAWNSQLLDYHKIRPNSDLIQFSPRATEQEFQYYDDMLTDSDSSGYYPPISYRDNNSPVHSGRSSDEEYVRPISIIDRVAPRRKNTQTSQTYTIEKIEIVPPPAIYAPRPGFAVWAEKLVETAEDLPMWLSAPTRRKYNDEIIHDEPDIPRRIPRSKIRGLEPQDATAALVNFLGWYAFFISRLLSIAVFIDMSIIAAVIVLFSHYQIMLLLLIVPQAPTVKRGFYFFLAFIYLFCLMEFKIRFRHVRVWHLFWALVTTAESILFTALWATVKNDVHSWWRNYVVKIIYISMVISYLCFLVYFVLLKPKETIVNINNKSNKYNNVDQ